MLMRSPNLRTSTAKWVRFIGLPWIVHPGEGFVFCLLGSQRNCTRTPWDFHQICTAPCYNHNQSAQRHDKPKKRSEL